MRNISRTHAIERYKDYRQVTEAQFKKATKNSKPCPSAHLSNVVSYWENITIIFLGLVVKLEKESLYFLDKELER